MLTLSLILCSAIPSQSAKAEEIDLSEYPILTKDVCVRDTFVLLYDGLYYMYGTGLAPHGPGYGCTVSPDLEHWSENKQIFTPPEGFDGVADWWAPECHYYNGGFYLFATYRSAKSGKRGTAIFKSDSPTGPFELWSDGHVTPKYRDCIDGTLYVDEDGIPWIVYVGEWTSSEDGVGLMCAAKLSGDLSQMISEPITLFRARDTVWTNGFITDGPFLYRSVSGKLLMTWSNTGKKGYTVALAKSLNGRVDGKWVHSLTPLYQKDNRHEYEGGHGMIFTDKNGQLILAIHSPNYSDYMVHETAKFIPVADLGNRIVLLDGCKLYNTFYKTAGICLKLIYKPLDKIRNIFDK